VNLDTVLLQAIMAQPNNKIPDIVQAALENEGTLYDRLSKGYYELTNQDPGADSDGIGLR
jgi:hypothetical protein